MLAAAFQSAAPHLDLATLWRALIYDAPYNTVVVLRGTTILGLACGAIGALLLLRKRSLVADALSHAALPGVCVGFLVAAAFGHSGRSLLVLIPAAAAFGLVGVACIHLLTRVPRIREDAAIGAVLSVFFALGMVLLSVIQGPGPSNKAGLKQFIFGQAATMTTADTNIIAALAAAVLCLAFLLRKEFKLLCFDSPFAQSLGWSTLALDSLLLMMVTVLTVIGLHAVGAVLMVALLIIPAAAAKFWTTRLSVMLMLSAALGAVACHVGTAVSAVAPSVPTGPAIVTSCGAVFIVSLLFAPYRGLAANLWRRIRLARTVARQHLLRAMYEQGEISGQPDAAVTVEQLLARRAWTAHRLATLIHRGLRRAELRAALPDGYVLTPAGRDAAARIVRTHRMWEHFLTTQADIAPSHVDRAADDIEHVLSDELIRDLEAELRASGALAKGEFVPRSPHRLAAKAVIA